MAKLNYHVDEYYVDGVFYHVITDGNHSFWTGVLYMLQVECVVEKQIEMTMESFIVDLRDMLCGDVLYMNAVTRMPVDWINKKIEDIGIGFKMAIPISVRYPA